MYTPTFASRAAGAPPMSRSRPPLAPQLLPVVVSWAPSGTCMHFVPLLPLVQLLPLWAACTRACVDMLPFCSHVCSMKHRSAPKEKCPVCLSTGGTLVKFAITYSRGPMKPTMGQTLRSPRPKVSSVLTRYLLTSLAGRGARS